MSSPQNTTMFGFFVLRLGCARPDDTERRDQHDESLSHAHTSYAAAVNGEPLCRGGSRSRRAGFSASLSHRRARHAAARVSEEGLTPGRRSKRSGSGPYLRSMRARSKRTMRKVIGESTSQNSCLASLQILTRAELFSCAMPCLVSPAEECFGLRSRSLR